MVFRGFPLLPVLALVSSITLLLLVARTPQALYSDPAWQLKALQQYLSGESQSFNKLAQPSPSDLSVNSSEWISWWPLGTNILVYPLLRAGMAMGTAVRCLSGVALLVGSFGFGYWLSLVRIRQWMAVTLALGIPWIRYANLGLFSYTPEALVYAIAPWVVVGTLRLGARWSSQQIEASLVLPAVLGLLLGCTYWLKYSAVFISFGAILYLAAAAWQHRNRPYVVRDLLVAVSIFVTLVAGLNVLNRAMGAAMNNVTQALSVHFEWAVPVNVVGLFAMAMADADGLWRYILFHPGGALLQFNYTYLCLIGLPGGLVLLWLLVRPSREEAVLVARYVFLTALGSFVLVTIVYGARAYEARYVSAIGIMLIPIAFHSAHEQWPRASTGIRIVLILTGVFYIAIPMAYGVAAVVAKVGRTPTYTTGPSHFYNPLLADTDARAVVNELTEGFVSSTDVWYLTEPISALDLPGRAIIRHADFLSPDELRRDRFCTNRPVRMRLLLPPSFEQNGKAQVIMDSFGEAQNWHRATVAGANYVLWTAELGVTERSEVIARGVLGRTPLRMLRIGVLLPHRTDSHEPGP